MSTRVLQAARSAFLAVALAAFVGTTSGQVKPKALTLTPMDYYLIAQIRVLCHDGLWANET